jgi:hypothetical protein
MIKHYLISIPVAALILIALVSLVSCNREDAPDCFQRAGEMKTVQRDLDDFSSIELNDYIQYELFDTAYFGVIIKAPGNLISDIETEVEDGRLTIRNVNRCNFVRSFKSRITVRICAPAFTDIQNYATGDITSVDVLTGNRFSLDNRSAAGVQRISLDVDTVNIASHTGVSDAVLQGECDVVYLFNQGLGKLDARALTSNYAFVNNSSLNDVYVYSQNYLYGYIQFSGNIYYTGNPEAIDREVDGDGELKPF